YGVGAIDSGQLASPAEGTQLVRYRALAAIVEPTNYSSVKLDESEMEKYLRVLDEVHAHSAVLPAPPGTVFRSIATLSQWLELHYFTLTEALSSVEGHSAARVNILKQGTQDEGDVQRSFAALAAESLRMLRAHAGATVTLPTADGDADEGVVARASFLVDTERWQAFEEAVSAESNRQGALDITVSGPWPPYDFVRMQFGG
ncbi:MAG TPA: GvpL/GvpF family gas vesicle protein, partial [Gemmatimonadaceae bacterium]|nr:GvpL/GvpF family gas vesicle protein [Gemmatimonadaceae bacterium]